MKRIPLIAVACLVSMGSARADEVKLKAASFLPERSVIAQLFYRWAKEVNSRCKGEVAISIVGPAAIGSLEQWNALKSGVVDMHYGPSNYYKGAAIEAEATLLARRSPSEQRRNGAWAMINEVHNRKMNAQYLTYLLHDVRMFLWTRKEAKNGNFSGMRVRSVPIYDGFFRSLGIATVRMSPPDVFTGLERGTVDGYGWPLWGVVDFGWHKYTKFRYGPGFLQAVGNILVNLDKWKAMTDPQRTCLTNMAKWVESEWPKWLAEVNKKQLAILDKAGIKYVDMGKDFAAKAENLYWKELEKQAPEFVKKIRPLLSK